MTCVVGQPLSNRSINEPLLVTGAQLPHFPKFPIPESPTTLKLLTPKRTPPVFRVSMGGGDCLPLGDLNACLPAYSIKINKL
ncbi:hypothetical protein SFRURICE_000099 [Spodoptera frugiperda]|nr:hypothetical protein SFRURICE_000099 [Spodoptera frugiperda]